MDAESCLTMTPLQVEKRYGLKRNHLNQLRYQNLGPKYIQATPRTVLYRVKDIEEWLDANTVETQESHDSRFSTMNDSTPNNEKCRR